jgi:hypothetical protein
MMLFALAACKRQVHLDKPRLAAELDKRASAALETPAVEKSLDELFAAVSADARVGSAGEKVMGGLGDDPRLQPAFAKIMEMLVTQPALKAAVVELMRQNPKATSDQIGEMMGNRISAVFSGPGVSHAMDSAFNGLFKRPELGSLLNTFGEKAVRNPHMAQLISSTFDDDSLDKRWGESIVALNGGSVPDRARATDLVADKMLTTERLSRWYVKVYTLPATKREVAAGAARLLEAPAFRRHTATLVAALVGDTTFQQRSVDGMNVLMAAQPSPDAIQKAVQRLLDAPVVATALAAWMKSVMSDPELGVIGDDIAKKLAAAPEVRAAFAELAQPL